MKRRESKDYDAIFKALKKEALELSLELNPHYFMFDFEIAAIKSFKKIFKFSNYHGLSVPFFAESLQGFRVVNRLNCGSSLCSH